MSSRWFDALRPFCEDACLRVRLRYSPDVLVFYVARWCQKQARTAEPDVASLGSFELRDAAERIAAHLADDGPRVERLVAGDGVAWTTLRQQLVASARRRVGAAAEHLADEALQKIAVVLLTGTPPSNAAERLRQGPSGPTNEYVFQSPFGHWARTVTINLIKDERRRAGSERAPERATGRRASQALDRAALAKAAAALPGLLDAVRQLPPAQRSVMALSFACSDLDQVVRRHLHGLAPDLFGGTAGVEVSSDRDIAARLGSTPHRVAANRSAARRKLSRRDPDWALLLDVLLPHRSTRPE